MLQAPNCDAKLIGVVALRQHESPSLARLSRKQSARHFDAGPVEYLDAPKTNPVPDATGRSSPLPSRQ